MKLFYSPSPVIVAMPIAYAIGEMFILETLDTMQWESLIKYSKNPVFYSAFTSVCVIRV